MQEEEVEAVRQTAARLANTNKNKKKLLESLGAAVWALNCVLASHVVSGGLSDAHTHSPACTHTRIANEGEGAHEEERERGRAVFFAVYKLYKRLAVALCTPERRGCRRELEPKHTSVREQPHTSTSGMLPCDKHIRHGTTNTSLLGAVSGHCRGWRHALLRRGIGSMGLVLAAVFKGSDAPPDKEKGTRERVLSCLESESQKKETAYTAPWMPPYKQFRGSGVEAVGARGRLLGLPAELLLEAREELRRCDYGGVGALGFLGAVCRSSALAGAAADAAVMLQIFGRGAQRGKGIFFETYWNNFSRASCSSATRSATDAEKEEEARVAEEDTRRGIWEALFASAGQLQLLALEDVSLSPRAKEEAKWSCHNNVLRTIIGAISCDQPHVTLAPLLQARPVGIVLECARHTHTQTRKNALLLLSELVGIGGQAPGIWRDSSLVLLLQDDICAGAAAAADMSGGAFLGEPCMDALERVLGVCEARASDCIDNIWSGFIFVMFILSKQHCPRLHALVAGDAAADVEARGGARGGAGSGAASGGELKALSLQTKIARFITRWAQEYAPKMRDQDDSIFALLDSDGCRALVPSLLQLLEMPGVAGAVASQGGFAAIWHVLAVQPNDWLLGGEEGGGIRCMLVEFLACLLQSHESIRDISLHVGIEQVKGFINRIIVETGNSNFGGGVGGSSVKLGRDKRDKLCGFLERLDRAQALLV